jgi:hypothetical protein
MSMGFRAGGPPSSVTAPLTEPAVSGSTAAEGADDSLLP